MNTGTVIVALIVLLIVISIIIYMIRKRKAQKNSGCGGGCCGCPMAGDCQSTQVNAKETTKNEAEKLK